MCVRALAQTEANSQHQRQLKVTEENRKFEEEVKSKKRAVTDKEILIKAADRDIKTIDTDIEEVRKRALAQQAEAAKYVCVCLCMYARV